MLATKENTLTTACGWNAVLDLFGPTRNKVESTSKLGVKTRSLQRQHLHLWRRGLHCVEEDSGLAKKADIGGIGPGER
jgi:hypothetical protein